MAATPSCPRLQTSPSDETATVRGVPPTIARIPVAGSRLGRAAVSTVDTSISRAPSRSTWSASAASCEPSSRSVDPSRTASTTPCSPASKAFRRRSSWLITTARLCARMSTPPQCRPTSRKNSACSTAERPLPPAASGTTSPNQPVVAKSARTPAVSPGEAPVTWSRSSGIARDRNFAAVAAISISAPCGARNMFGSGDFAHQLADDLEPSVPHQRIAERHGRRVGHGTQLPRHLHGIVRVDFVDGERTPRRRFHLIGDLADQPVPLCRADFRHRDGVLEVLPVVPFLKLVEASGLGLREHDIVEYGHRNSPLGFSDPGRQRLPAAHRRRSRHLGPLVIDLPLGPTREYLFESDTTLEASEARAETEMNAVAEAQVVDVPAPHVETI